MNIEHKILHWQKKPEELQSCALLAINTFLWRTKISLHVYILFVRVLIFAWHAMKVLSIYYTFFCRSSNRAAAHKFPQFIASCVLNFLWKTAYRMSASASQMQAYRPNAFFFVCLLLVLRLQYSNGWHKQKLYVVRFSRELMSTIWQPIPAVLVRAVSSECNKKERNKWISVECSEIIIIACWMKWTNENSINHIHDKVLLLGFYGTRL